MCDRLEVEAKTGRERVETMRNIIGEGNCVKY